MGLCHSIFWKVDINDATGLQEKFPNERVSDSLVEVADVDGRILVLFPISQLERARYMLELTYQCRAPDMTCYCSAWIEQTQAFVTFGCQIVQEYGSTPKDCQDKCINRKLNFSR